MDHIALKIKVKIMQNGRFPILGTEEDRINFMTDGFIKYKYDFGRYPNERKNSVKAAKFRNKGNELLTADSTTSPALELALQSYSKSILYAPPGSKELSLAYANRSVVMFRARRYEGCLLDIDRALRAGYPEELKPKLLIRMAKCIYALTDTMDAVNDALKTAKLLADKLPPENVVRQIVEDYVHNPDKILSVGKFTKKHFETNYVIQLENENPKFPGTSDAMKLKYSKEYGMHLVAARDIKSGEVLVLQKPYTLIIDNYTWYKLCSHCGQRSWNGVPCDDCVYVMYCSDECKNAAWSEYHDIECKVFEPAIELKRHSFMGLRLTVKALKETGGFEKLKQRLNELDALKEQGPDSEILVDSTSYSTLYTMPDPINHMSALDMPCFAANAVELTYFLATRTEILGQKFTGDLSVVRKAKWFTFAAALMAKNMRIAKSGGYRLIRGGPKPPRKESIYMVVPAVYFIKHSCASPIYILPSVNAMGIVVTNVPIKQGDPILASTGTYFMQVSKGMRQKILKRERYIDCNCDACKYNWTSASCISYRDQGLPPADVDRLDQLLIKCARTFADVYTMATKDGKNLINFICTNTDELCRSVRLPCTELQLFLKTFYDVFRYLTITYHADDKFKL